MRKYWLVLLVPMVMLVRAGVADAADCTEAKVKRLARAGNTVAAIATQCDMSRSDVRDIIEGDESDGDSSPAPNPGSRRSSGYPQGTPVGQCGCWGPANPGARVPQQQCQSGYARPQMCPAVCPMGGYMWQGVCT